MQGADGAAQARIAQSLEPAVDVVAATFHPAAHDRGGDHIGKPSEDARRAGAFRAHLALHRLQHRRDLRLPVEQRADQHHLWHQADEWMHAAKIELHAAAEDHRILRPATRVRADRDCADAFAEFGGLEAGDVRLGRSGAETRSCAPPRGSRTASPGANEHAIAPSEPRRKTVPAATKWNCARPGSVPKRTPKGGDELQTAIGDAREPHAQQQLAHQIEGRRLGGPHIGSAGRTINHYGFHGIDRPHCPFYRAATQYASEGDTNEPSRYRTRPRRRPRETPAWGASYR